MNETRDDKRQGSGPAAAPGANSLMGLYSLGITIALGMALFVFVGYSLDRRSGGGMRWTLLGAALGMVFCAYEVWRLLRMLQDEVRKPDGRPPQ